MKKSRKFFSGHFYPNMEVSKIEEGDLATHTPFAVKKKVKWVTDRYGYRKQNKDLQKHQVVIVGESNIAGSSLTQEELLSEVLESHLKVSVYPYAPVRSINSFLKDRRFIENVPDTIVFARIERELLDMDAVEPVRAKKFSSRSGLRLQENRTIQSVAIPLNRISKMAMLHSFRASLRRGISPSNPDVVQFTSSQHGPVFFLQGTNANEEVTGEKVDRAIEIIRSYNEEIRRRGMRFIFLPIPNKENVFYKELKTRRPVFLEQLIAGLKKYGVETIDTQKAFEEAYRRDNVLLYHTDDTHWNGNAVKITADLLAKAIEGKERDS